MSSDVNGGSQINFLVPRPPGVARTESSGHTPVPKKEENGPRIFKFALQRRPRAKRASASKVRTGCNTCKRRHVKCDEAKPSCRRCVKWRGFCDGYDTSGGSLSSTPGPDSDLDGASSAIRASKSPPAETLAANGAAQPCSPFDGPTPPAEDTDSPFRDPTERRYFDHWLAYRHRLGGGFFGEPLWTETVPQMSRQHASVRYAAMAVGGIAEALRQQSLELMGQARTGANGPHYALALSYYGSAIREIRRAELNTGSLRAAIVCCLLFVCFEVLHGDRRAALSHVDNGRKMTDELLRRRCEEEEGRLGRNVVGVGADSAETDALRVFQRLIQQSWACGVPLRRDPDASEQASNDDGQEESLFGRPWCCRGDPGGERALHKMHPTFATLREARRWRDVTQHDVTHSSDIAFRLTQLGLGDDLASECDERVQRHMDEIETARAGAEPSPPSFLV